MLRRHPCALLLPTLLIPVALAGCTSTAGVRTAGKPQIRTIASVGDRPLPPVTGTPGSSVAAAEATPEPRRSPQTRVSGRVLDEKGRPVANATVRPAAGAASGGRLVEAKTDRSGGFTLHGLRPDARYTLIAEYETDDGVKSGRVDVRSADSGVEISLADPTLDERLGADEESRARSISNREILEGPDEEPIPPPLKRSSRVNLEDLPTTEEVEAQDPSPTSFEDQAAPRIGRETPAPRSSGWKRLDGSATRASATATEEVEPSLPKRRPPVVDDPPKRDNRPAVEPPTEMEEDSENPLPPAIDPTEPRRPTGTTSTGAAPRAVAMKPREPEPDSTAGDFRLAPPESETAPRVSWDEPNESAPVSPEPKRMTWDDVAVLAPPAESTPGKGGKARLLTARSPSNATLPDPAPKLSARGSPGAGVELCKFDARQSKLTDFRLPDIEGRPVSFKDLDSDYVLLDFWGTWCQPCIRTVPHLVDLQNRYGKDRIRVVGIACEKGTFEQRTAKAATMAEKLGVNYPVLVSSVEEFSPIQDAFRIQSFPTLILVDRSGKVVWREQGGSQVTLTRLERVLESTSRGDVARR